MAKRRTFVPVAVDAEPLRDGFGTNSADFIRVGPKRMRI